MSSLAAPAPIRADRSPIDVLLRRNRPRPWEAAPWLIAGAAYFVFPDYLALGAQILIMVVFALSLDLVLGYAGIVTLGHAAFFGMGAYAAGILGARGWTEPFSGLVVAAVAAGLLGLASGAVILRTRGLTLLMLTLVTAAMVSEIANRAGWLTGGEDGLQGVTIAPVLDLFRFDMFGRTAYLYCLAALFLVWAAARIVVLSPFGAALCGIRENVGRMHAIGSPVFRRLLAIYTISAAMAGVAGGLSAQTTQFVGLKVLSFELSGNVVIMLILGGIGRLYGAFIGAPLYMLAQDWLAKEDPAYWYFWIGLLLVLAVFFARGGVLGLAERLLRRASRR
jgi:branched-chain amino acid transport system permease protein